MGDYISFDYSPIISAIREMERKFSSVTNSVDSMKSDVNSVKQQTLENMKELLEIKKQFVEMEKRQRFSAALQIAVTEIIRVRQEVESKFGTHKAVRDNMLGILQASDLGLIRESTISRCTEELMISAPKYWLAPCLIALAAWISNNESLAKRAVAEGIKRDREKTCLLFALICRRVNAGRIQAGKPSNDTATFEWLAEYFKLQNPKAMKKSVIAYIDAYTNGIFGKDKDNICIDHIEHWMQVLKTSNPNFVKEQKDYWKNFFNAQCSKSTTDYAALQKICVQYNSIHDYLQRIDASENQKGIKHFVKEIINAPIDSEELIHAIDDQLIRLVSNYEDDEMTLRDEEQYLTWVKEFKGDEERAQRLMDNMKSGRIDVNVDFARRLANSVFTNDTTASQKKTAVVLLRPYINEAFSEFILEKKDAYPQSIQLTIHENGKISSSQLLGDRTGVAFKFVGNTKNAENRKTLVDGLSQMYTKAKEDTLKKITDDAANKKIKVGKILTATVIFAIIPIGPIMWNKGKKALKANELERKHVEAHYNEAQAHNIALLNKALDERVATNKIVENFLADNKNETISF